jgi:imidazole glycerol-phosphate synthase subunit HisH
MIAIVDYGAGNLTSVKKALDRLGVECAITRDPDVVAIAGKIILPGVGHFSSTAMLDERGLRAAILSRLKEQAPFLGVCVGMQWMFASSEEAPETSGASLLAGKCERFPANVKSPHVGWNSLICEARSVLLRDVPSGSFVYFTHSYRAPLVKATVARSEYGGEFSAAVERDHLFGVQFHPEKSGRTGMQLLKNFCEI